MEYSYLKGMAEEMCVIVWKIKILPIENQDSSLEKR